MMGEYFGFGFGWLPMLILVALIIWAIFVLVGSQANRDYHTRDDRDRDDSRRGERSSEAMEILKQRYAKGELTREEFDRMKNDLQ